MAGGGSVHGGRAVAAIARRLPPHEKDGEPSAGALLHARVQRGGTRRASRARRWGRRSPLLDDWRRARDTCRASRCVRCQSESAPSRLPLATHGHTPWRRDDAGRQLRLRRTRAARGAVRHHLGARSANWKRLEPSGTANTGATRRLLRRRAPSELGRLESLHRPPRRRRQAAAAAAAARPEATRSPTRLERRRGTMRRSAYVTARPTPGKRASLKTATSRRPDGGAAMPSAAPARRRASRRFRARRPTAGGATPRGCASPDAARRRRRERDELGSAAHSTPRTAALSWRAYSPTAQRQRALSSTTRPASVPSARMPSGPMAADRIGAPTAALADLRGRPRAHLAGGDPARAAAAARATRGRRCRRRRGFPRRTPTAAWCRRRATRADAHAFEGKVDLPLARTFPSFRRLLGRRVARRGAPRPERYGAVGGSR